MTNTLTFTKEIQASLGNVYHTFSTKSGWLEWFSHKGDGSVGKGQILHVNPEASGSYALHFVTLASQQTVNLTLIDLSTYSTADVQIDLHAENGEVTVTLKAETQDDDLAEKMQTLWEKSLTNLKSVVETGKDLSLWNRPFLGVTVDDWVSPELAEEKGLPVDYGMLLNSVFEGGGADKAGIDGQDIIVALDGVNIVDYDSLLGVFSKHKSGDTIPVDFYHGEEFKQNVLTLSQYPVPEIPGTAQDLSDRFSEFFGKVNTKIEQLLEGQSEAQLNYRPVGGEWSALEIIAHLTAGFTDSIEWLGGYISGRPVHAYTSGLPARINTLLALYPTLDELLDAFKQSQQELIILLEQIPAEVSGRKSSLARIAYAALTDYSYHYKEHLHQLQETLEQAVDVRSI